MADYSMGGLLGMPSMEVTEEDKRQALKQMLMQMGMGLVANSHKGNQAALGAGLLGGVQGYQQGMQGPMNRFEMAKRQLDFQGKQLGNAKTSEELAKMRREAGDYSKQNDFLSMLSNPAALSMMGGGGPTNAALDRASQFASNPAAALSDPNVNLRALAARVDPKQLGAALENTRPFAMDAGKTYQYGDGRERYIPKLGEGIRPTANGGSEMVPGYDVAQNRMNYATKSGDLAAQLNYDRAKLPFDVQRAGGVAGAEAAARDPFNFQTIEGPNGAKMVMTNPQLRGAATNQFPGARVDPATQAQRDQVRRQILTSEGQDLNTPTRINDNPGAGLAPQLAGLPGIQGANPVVQKAREAVNTQWLEKTYQPLADAGSAAQSNLDNIKGLRSVNLRTGAGTETLGALANWGAAFGIPQAEKYAGNVQQFRALALENVNKELNLAKGPQTDQDAQRAKSIFVQLGNTPQANEFLLDYRQAAEQQKKRAAAFHADALPLATNSGDLSEVSRRWRKVAGSIWDDPIMQKWVKK